MKKKLVFLVVALVALLAITAVASAATNTSLHWENNKMFDPHDLITTKIVVDNKEVTIKNVELYKPATCYEAAQWKLYYDDTNAVGAVKEVYVIGYFDWDGSRQSGHVYAPWDDSGKLIQEAITVLPTCESEGKAAGQVCIYCGKPNPDGGTRTIPKLPHEFVKTIVTFPSCVKAEGELKYVCQKCGKAIKKDENSKDIVEKVTLAQVYADPKLKAQYEAAGYTSDGHLWDGWGAGATACLKQRHCKLCHVTQEKKAEATWSILDAKVIDCYWMIETRICSACNGKTVGHEKREVWIYAGAKESGEVADEYRSETQAEIEQHAFHVKGDLIHYIDKNGAVVETWNKTHELGAVNFCVDPYTEVYTCKRCGQEIKVAHGPDGHVFLDWVQTEVPGSLENEEGEWIRKCKLCGWSEKYHGKTAPSASYVAEVYDTENGFQNKNGTWGWYKNGNLQTGIYTMVPYMGGWFVVADGKWDTSFEGLYTYDGAQFYVSGGQVRNDLQGFVNTKTGFFYFADGMLQKVTTLVQYDGAWFYIIDGKLATEYTGPVTYDGAVFNVVGGQVQ